jgi:SAM-dependent methyltransferase
MGKQNSEQQSHYQAAKAYAESFVGEARVNKHINKFSKRIDKIRGDLELIIIGKFARGNIFDCSIGFGRFVGRMPLASSYAGMDASISFVEHVKKNHPDIIVIQGSLLDGIAQPDGAYDTTLCIRTLPVLPNIPFIINEMARITRPNGLIIFTYGLKPSRGQIEGQKFISSAYDVKKLCNDLDLKVVKIVPKDTIMIKFKNHPTLNRLFNSRLNILPDSFFRFLDLWMSKIISGDDAIFILRKTA